MCGSMCPQALAKFFGLHRLKEGQQRGKRPETFLTAYEMEQLPEMLRELERANRHFWQMVCWRWTQQEQKANSRTERSPKKGPEADTQSIGRSPQRRAPKGCPDDSYTDGCALRELVRVLTKKLNEKGTFDVEAEAMLADFRARIVGFRLENAMMKESKAEKRRREFMKLRAISFNGGLGEAVAIVVEKDHTEAEKAKSSISTSASSSASSGYSSDAQKLDRKVRASNWLRQRAHSVRDRRAGRCSCCADNDRIVRLCELLNSEFHSIVFAHPTAFDVHERELKLLVWRRFTQMLVAVWTDRERFGGQQEEKK